MVRKCRREKGAYDSNFFIAVFKTATCPEALVNVTHITSGANSLFIHHHRFQPRIPCFSCYSPVHTSTRCPRKDGGKAFKYHRDFTATLASPVSVPHKVMTHMSLSDRRTHIDDNAKASAEAVARLRTAAGKKPLLAKAERDIETTPHRTAKLQGGSSQEVKRAGPALTSVSENEWFDPANTRSRRAKSVPKSTAVGGGGTARRE